MSPIRLDGGDQQDLAPAVMNVTLALSCRGACAANVGEGVDQAREGLAVLVTLTAPPMLPSACTVPVWPALTRVHVLRL